MKTIILPGFSLHNKEWVCGVGKKVNLEVSQIDKNIKIFKKERNDHHHPYYKEFQEYLVD